MIPAYSPQARGRCERAFATWQGRLPQELRLRGMDSLRAANEYLRGEYVAAFNRSFQVPAAQRGTAFTARARKGMELIFSIQSERVVKRDNTVEFENLALQIEPVKWRGTLAGSTVTVHRHLDQTLSLTLGPLRLGEYTAEGICIEALKLPPAPQHAVEKTRGGKAQKQAFPPRLEIPPNTRDSHFPPASATAG